MSRTRTVIKIFILLVSAVAGAATAQTTRPRGTEDLTRNQGCPLTGAYRIDVAESDKLYSVVEGATSTVPFGDQQRFFMDLSVRLTPPDMLAIECSGQRVSVGSSRSPRITFIADGKTRGERSQAGAIVNSRVSLHKDTLTFVSSGKAEDNINVAFQSIDNGRRMRVTRRIYAEQLTQPIVIRTVYNRVADSVNWESFREPLTAAARNNGDRPTTSQNFQRRANTGGGGNTEAARLRRALDDWIGATNQRNIQLQMAFYMPQLKAFYLSRNTTQNLVRAEKQRAFSTARSIDIKAEEPEIVFQDGGRTAIMRFRKTYKVADRQRVRSGEVVQELRWQRTPRGWRIFSERDVRVIR